MTSAPPPAIDFLTRPGQPLRGSLRVPGDKSISHRALMLGAIAEGDTHISGFLAGEDTHSTLGALAQMGVHVDRPEATELTVKGAGLYGLRAPAVPLYLGNSGTSARLFAGLLSGQRFDSELIGDESLSRRPMRRLVDPLTRMGATLSCTPSGMLPIRIRGGARLRGMEHELPVASAQLKSALLLAGLYAEGTTCVREPALTRDHTERMLDYFGCPVSFRDGLICVSPQPLFGRSVQVPGDISSAAFCMVAASIVPGSDLVLEEVGVNPTRSAVIDILRSMGADIEVRGKPLHAVEPVADIRVRHHPLRGIAIPENLVSIAIDEFPILMIAAAFADGVTRVSGAAELRVKESDRIAAMADGLQAIGIRSEPSADGITVYGGVSPGGVVNSHGDHRIAMSFAVAGLAAAGPVKATDCLNVDTSFPGFPAALRSVGGEIEVHAEGRDG